MALRRRFLPVFKKHAPRGKPRFAKPLQGHFGPAAKHSQKHNNRPKIGRFSHFNTRAEMHPFSLFSASKEPQKWLCDAICRKKQLFAGSFGSRSHSFCSFTAAHQHIQLVQKPRRQLFMDERPALRGVAVHKPWFVHRRLVFHIPQRQNRILCAISDLL